MSTSELSCSICLSNETEHMIETNCGHNFHKLCIHKWINLPNYCYNNCPVCRGNINALGNYLNIDDIEPNRIWYLHVKPPYWVYSRIIERNHIPSIVSGLSE